jgi:hypothetical protein
MIVSNSRVSLRTGKGRRLESADSIGELTLFRLIDILFRIISIMLLLCFRHRVGYRGGDLLIDTLDALFNAAEDAREPLGISRIRLSNAADLPRETSRMLGNGESIYGRVRS